MLEAASIRKATSASRLWKIWLGVAALAAGFVGLTEQKIPLFVEWNTLFEQNPLSFRWFALSIILTALSIGAVFILLIQSRDEQLAKSEEQRKEAITNLDNLEALFRDRERMRMLDHITGIPNFECWQNDLQTWASRGRNEFDFSLIIIDIDKLRWLNERSRECADEVLRFFARNTYESMRRDEQIYKAPEVELKYDRDMSKAEMYRHYQGGDEFFFIIRGDVYDAIGFINRLADRTESQYSKQIRSEILAKYLNECGDIGTFELKFSGAIEPIRPRTAPETALRNSYEGLRRAKEYKRSRLRVVFETDYETPADRQIKLEQDLRYVQNELASLSDSSDNAKRIIELRDKEKTLDLRIKILKKAGETFPISPFAGASKL